MNTRLSPPAMIETLRTFLNTFFISNETHVAEDTLTSQLALEQFQQQYFSEIVPNDDVETLCALRQSLRLCLEKRDSTPLNAWLNRFPVYPSISKNQQEQFLMLYRPGSTAHTLCQEIIIQVLLAMNAQQWQRLKVCADCQWVFYDRSKNNSRRWCSMNSTAESGRSCGSIMKMRNWRERQKQLQNS